MECNPKEHDWHASEIPKETGVFPILWKCKKCGKIIMKQAQIS